MPKSKGRQRPKPPAENDVKFKDELKDPQKQPLSQKDRFWKAARQYLQNGMQSPWDWMNANDGMEAAQESQEDYFESMEDFYQQNPAGVPGGGSYIGDETAAGQAPASPYAQQGMVEQMAPPTMEGFFPPPTEADQYTQDLIQGTVTSYPDQVPYRPRPEVPAPQGAPQAASGQSVAMPTGFEGAPPDQAALAIKYGQEFGVDPGVLLAIAKHETNFGTLGLGKKGLTLGYGAYDSGPSMKWQGPEAQYRGAASTLSKWGVKGIDDITAGKAGAYATDPKWESGIASAYKGLAPQLSGAPAAATAGLQGSTDVFDEILKGIEAGTIDPKVLDTLGPGLSSLADTTEQTADEVTAALTPDEEEDDEE